jgi:hypothetical protein
MIIWNANEVLLTARHAAGQRRAVAHDRPDPTGGVVSEDQ